MARTKPVIAIEHLEDYTSEWLLLEYKHASSLYQPLVITNARCYYDILSKITKTYEKSILELEGELYTSQSKLIILDPLAPETLSHNDTKNAEIIVVGGILGDHPPRGRTYKLLSSRTTRALIRNLGSKQLSIDGAVYVASRIINGGDLKDIKFVDNPRIKTITPMGFELEIELPFTYPVVQGKPLFPRGFKELVSSRLLYEEYRELESSREYRSKHKCS